MAVVDSAGTGIYYETHGSGEPVLFAHGAGGNAGIWFQQVAALAPDYQCVTFDHRTFARSPAPPETVSPQQFRDDALAILDVLEIDRAHLVAQSMGGWTCMRLLLDSPDRVLSLTMSCTPGGLPNQEVTESIRDLTSSSGPGSRGVLDTMAPATLADPVRMLLYETINGFNTGFSMTNLKSLGDSANGISLEELDRVEVPVLFISGESDPLFPSALLESYVPHFPDARIEVVRDAGHSPYFEQPQVFNRLLKTFLLNGNG